MKKLTKPTYSSTQFNMYIKDKNGNFLTSQNEQLNRFAEHYQDLASDVTGHSLDDQYWKNILANSPISNETWDINQPITMAEIESTVFSMKNNKAPGPDGIPSEFFKAFFDPNRPSSNGNDNTASYSDCAKCLFSIFTKIWNGDFPSNWNSASIVSIPKKGDLSDCNNYRGISLIIVKIPRWGIKNEMTFGINKCATLVVKPMKFSPPRNYTDPTFYLGIHPLPKTNQYTYLGIPFDDSLELSPIIAKMNSKINLVVNYFSRFLSNKDVPFFLKKLILVSYVLSSVIYFAPLFGSNKLHIKKAQTALNRALYRCFGFPNNTSNTTIYNMLKELSIPPIASICANAQIRCYNKWKNSSCVISHLIKNIPPLSHYSWTKKSRRLAERRFKDKKPKEIKKYYLENDFFTHNFAIKSVKFNLFIFFNFLFFSIFYFINFLIFIFNISLLKFLIKFFTSLL